MKYIFISYINRSGSTYLANQISKSSFCCVCPEADILFDILLRHPLQKNRNKRIIKHILNDPKIKMWKLDRDLLEKLLNEKLEGYKVFFNVLSLYREKENNKAVFILFKHNHINVIFNYLTEQQRKNVFHITLLRNPANTYLSQKNTISPNTLNPMCKNPYTFCRQFNQFYCNVWQKQSPDTYRLIFEKLINNLNNEMQELLYFLGISDNFSDTASRIGSVYKSLNTEYRAVHNNIINPPDITKSEDVWPKLIVYEQYLFSRYLTLTNNIYPVPDSQIKPVFNFRIRLLLNKIAHAVHVTRQKLHYFRLTI
ncbi:MAG: hypothetical protein JW894_04105 [Bacteroidales bacterium]|nr:hypothetical protein [Bacteroidales bacterium]